MKSDYQTSIATIDLKQEDTETKNLTLLERSRKWSQEYSKLNHKPESSTLTHSNLPSCIMIKFPPQK